MVVLVMVGLVGGRSELLKESVVTKYDEVLTRGEVEVDANETGIEGGVVET